MGIEYRKEGPTKWEDALRYVLRGTACGGFLKTISVARAKCIKCDAQLNGPREVMR